MRTHRRNKIQEEQKIEKKQSKHLIGCIICGLLTTFGIVVNIISLIGGKQILGDCCLLVLYILITYYAFAGYKKPHGNLLKFIILIRAALKLTRIFLYIKVENAVDAVIIAVEIGLLCYIAGRLAKSKENLVLMIIVTFCEVMCLVFDITLGIATIGVVAPLIIWLDICVAYFLRYKEHREAGLADAPKKQ